MPEFHSKSARMVVISISSGFHQVPSGIPADSRWNCVMVVKRNGQLGKASSSIYHCLFCYNILLALIRDTVGSSNLALKGLYKVL